MQARGLAPTARPTRRGRLAAANINPATGLATDYLNHFNEAIMLLEMLSSCPECLDDFLDWRPMSYREHFEARISRAARWPIAAYEAADPDLRDCLDALGRHHDRRAGGDPRGDELPISPPAAAAALAERAAAWLKPLVARAGAVINGEDIATAGDRRRWSTG